MATLRFLHTDFWKDNFFSELTPEDKYFYIYLLTNDRCSQCGIYDFGVKFAALELGYSVDTVKTLIKRFIDYGKILYDDKNGEIMIINWYKYNMNINNKNTRICINTCLKKVKSLKFIKTFYALCLEKYKNETGLINEIFSEVSFSSPKDSRAIIEGCNEEAMESICCNNEELVEDCVEKPFDNEEKLVDNVDKSVQSDSFCEENVDKFKNNVNSCGNVSLDNCDENKVIEVFQNNFHLITPIELQKIKDWCNEVSPKVVVKAIEVATLSNKRTMTYLNGILRNWLEGGVRTIEDYERMCRENNESKAKEKDKKQVRPPQYRVIPRERYEDEEDF